MHVPMTIVHLAVLYLKRESLLGRYTVGQIWHKENMENIHCIDRIKVLNQGGRYPLKNFSLLQYVWTFP